ncbi:MAG: hypothetical protein DDT39_01410 [Firmicutes bacterium]|nr:hypothetical protein [candidate division NPL-UPA2 bacterium]
MLRKYVMQRLVMAMITLWGATFVIFYLARLLPGDAVILTLM